MAEGTGLQVGSEVTNGEITATRREPLLKRIAPIFTMISAIVALTALFLNTYSRSRGLACTYLGNDSILQIDKGALPGPLVIRYRDQPIEALYALKFSIKNIGSSAIKDSDIKAPLELVFPRGFSLLDSITVRTRPEFSLSAQKDPNNQNRLILSFPLMNAGDEATITVNALGVGSDSPFLTGRIIDVKSITNLDLSKGKNEARLNQHINAPLVWTLVVLNGLLGAIFLFILLWSSFTLIQAVIWRTRWMTRAKAAIIAREKTYSSEGLKAVNADPNMRALFEAKVCQEAGIPKKPEVGTTERKDYFQIVALLLPLSALSGMTTIVLIGYATG